jgi:5'-nucleotidase
MSASRPVILVSNDDGYQSDGLVALTEALQDLGELWVVAPDREQSAASHAISLFRPLRLDEIRPRWFAVDGTPTDCSYLAINHLLKAQRPALCVSGINHGANLADDVIYSGTVAAAMEAALLGVPAIAFSLVGRGERDFKPGAQFARELVKCALARQLPPRMLLNVNIPAGVTPKGFAITRLGKHTYGYDVVQKTDPRGRKYYWIGGNEYQHEDIPGSDCNAVFQDKVVSVTPLHLDLTDDPMLGQLRQWGVAGFEQRAAK